MKSLLQAGMAPFISIIISIHPATIYSQACQVKNLKITVNCIVSTPSSCQINATISWSQKENSGNKFTNVHIWTSANYPNPPLNYSKPPTATDLANSLGTFVIDNPGSNSPVFDGSYPPAPGVNLITATSSTVVTKTSGLPILGMDCFTVNNVLITLSNTASCSGHFTLISDIWSSQANHDQTVQCSSAGNKFCTPDVSTIPPCPTPLPVTLVYFKASRMENSRVLLSWETATEQNNKGFEIQRKPGSGDFETIAFVSSKASQGTSESALTYEYVDADVLTGDAAYRLVQVDFDGHMRFSPLVEVRGNNEGSGLISIYPNPSPDGAITLSFDHTGFWDVIVTDISGRVIKNERGITTNRYSLNLLQTGIYVLKVVNRTSGQTSLNKMFVGR